MLLSSQTTVMFYLLCTPKVSVLPTTPWWHCPHLCSSLFSAHPLLFMSFSPPPLSLFPLLCPSLALSSLSVSWSVCLACLPCIVNIRDEVLSFSLSFARISNHFFPFSHSHTHGCVPHSNPLLRDTHTHTRTHTQSHSHRSPSLFLCRCLRASQLRRGLTSLPALSTCSHGW